MVEFAQLARCCSLFRCTGLCKLLSRSRNIAKLCCCSDHLVRSIPLALSKLKLLSQSVFAEFCVTDLPCGVQPMASMVRINDPPPSSATRSRAPRQQDTDKARADDKGRDSCEMTSRTPSQTARLSEVSARTPSQAEMSKLDVSASASQGTPRQQAQASRGIWGGIMNLLSPGDD